MLKTFKKIENLGQDFIDLCNSLGESLILLYRAIYSRFLFENSCSLLAKQIYKSGILSLFIISASGIFVGMILAFQGYTVFSKIQSETIIGQFIALCLIRELAPVIAALLFAGRSGSSMAAEIGFMKSSEQLSSMEMIGVDPVKYIISPMLWGGVISMPILFFIFCVVGIYGGAFIAITCLSVDYGAFWSEMQATITFSGDIVKGLIKSIVFGIVISWISVFQGWSSIPTAEGVGKSTTKAVVYSSLTVLGLDLILTALMFGDI
jgi:phospholipid/cholesterol/gamma-HCH transport system permease protein